jgi:hypothetical protein
MGTRLPRQPVLASDAVVIVEQGDRFEVQPNRGAPSVLGGVPMSLAAGGPVYTVDGRVCLFELPARIPVCVILEGRMTAFRQARRAAGPEVLGVLTSDGVLRVLMHERGRLTEIRRWTSVSDLNALDAQSVVFTRGNGYQWRSIVDDSVVGPVPPGTMPLYAEGDRLVVSHGIIEVVPGR